MPGQSVTDMPFARVYLLLVRKAERKGRTQAETDEIITWLTGYPCTAAVGDVTYGEFIANAPHWNPRSALITGTVCGVRVETIEDPMMKKIRQLDKLIDELAKGRPLDRIKR